MKSIKVIIADDHPIFLKGLEEVLLMDEELEIIAKATNGKEALLATQTYRADVVILDVDMPRMNGLEAAEKVGKLYPDLPIILLTMHKDKAPFIKALEIGVSGYVLKENAVNDIVHAIYTVIAGNAYISPEMSAYLLKKPQKTKTGSDEILQQLTPAESRVLRMIGEYKSSKEIAEELFISEKTVFNHRMNIAKKLNLTGKNSLLRFAIEHFV